MDEKMLSLEQETKIKEKALKLKEEKKLRKIYPPSDKFYGATSLLST